MLLSLFRDVGIIQSPSLLAYTSQADNTNRNSRLVAPEDTMIVLFPVGLAALLMMLGVVFCLFVGIDMLLRLLLSVTARLMLMSVVGVGVLVVRVVMGQFGLIDFFSGFSEDLYSSAAKIFGSD